MVKKHFYIMSNIDNKDILFIHLHNRPSLLSPFYLWVDSYLSSHSLLDYEDSISYLQNIGIDIDMSDIYPSDESFDDFYESHMDELDNSYDDYELVYPSSSSSSSLGDDDISTIDSSLYGNDDYSFDEACYNSAKRIYYYDDYMNKDNVMKFRSLRKFEKFCNEYGIYISPGVLSLMKYRPESHCCINKNILVDDNLVVLEAEESYGSMVYSAALPEEIDTMSNELSL